MSSWDDAHHIKNTRWEYFIKAGDIMVKTLFFIQPLTVTRGYPALYNCVSVVLVDERKTLERSHGRLVEHVDMWSLRFTSQADLWHGNNTHGSARNTLPPLPLCVSASDGLFNIQCGDAVPSVSSAQGWSRWSQAAYWQSLAVLSLARSDTSPANQIFCHIIKGVSNWGLS